MHLKLEIRHLRLGLLGAHIYGGGYALIGGIGALLAEQPILLQPPELRDGIAQSSGVFLQIHSVLLRILAGSGKIPGFVFV